MAEDDKGFQALLDDPDLALRQWYVSVTPIKDPGLILTGGAGPSQSRIREIFDQWVARRREELRVIVCENLRYGELSSTNRHIGEVATVAAVSSLLAASPWGNQIDPIATAAILVSTRTLDTLCASDEA